MDLFERAWGETWRVNGVKWSLKPDILSWTIKRCWWSYNHYKLIWSHKRVFSWCRISIEIFSVPCFILQTYLCKKVLIYDVLYKYHTLNRSSRCFSIVYTWLKFYQSNFHLLTNSNFHLSIIHAHIYDFCAHGFTRTHLTPFIMW